MEDVFNLRVKCLLSQWQKEGLKINSGVGDKDIAILEDVTNYKFEDDFKNYLKSVNGFNDFESDSEWFSFWSVDRLLSEYGDGHPKELVCFMDFTINLCSFGFSKMDNKVYTHFQHSEEIIFITDTFSDFIKLYLENPTDLIK